MTRSEGDEEGEAVFGAWKDDPLLRLLLRLIRVMCWRGWSSADAQMRCVLLGGRRANDVSSAEKKQRGEGSVDVSCCLA